MLPARSKPLASVRTILAWMILACVLPSLAAVAFLMVRDYHSGRAQLATNTIQIARAMVQAVDAQIDQGKLLALTLTTSDALVRRDFAAFHQRALRFINEQSLVQSVQLYERNGVAVLNTRLPFGQPLPQQSDPAQIERVFESGRPAMPEVIFSPWTRKPMVSMAFPVFAGSRVEYVLAMGISPNVFTRILAKQNPSPGWVVGVLDNSGTLAARTHSPEKFVGQKAVPAMLRLLADSSEGSHALTTHEGIQTVASYSRSEQSGWSVGIAIPRQVLEAKLRQGLLLTAAVAALTLGLSMGLVWFFGNRMADSMRALRASAASLGHGTRLLVPQVNVREAQEVAQTMAHAAQALRERSRALSASHAALVLREAELADAQRIAKIGSWSWDALTDSTTVSLEMSRIFGLQEVPLFGSQNERIYSHKAWLELRNAQMNMGQTGHGFNLELPAKHADGHQIWVNYRAEVLRDADGKSVGLRGMVQDITERKLAEKAALQSQRRYRTLVEDSSEAITVHRGGIVIFANLACARMFGAAAPSDIVGKALLDFVHPGFHQKMLERVKSISLLGEIAPLAELKLLKTDGAVIDGEAQSTVILFDGAPAIQIYLRDTTQRKRQDSELNALRLEMQTMMEWQVARHTVAALAHEINQPLASLSVLCEAASRLLVSHDLSPSGGRAPQRLEQALQRMASETQRAGIVMRQLIKSVQQPDIALEPIDLGELLGDAANLFLGEGVFNCRIHLSCPAGLRPVRANRMQITKVVLNLLGNAAQAMNAAQMAQRKIWIDAVLVQDETAVEVSVRDAGPGIIAGQELAIFQPFVTTKAHGLGMGLAISRALIEAHEGKLWLQAHAGPGALFHFTLPTTPQAL